MAMHYPDLAVPPLQLRDLLIDSMYAGLVPYVSGSPGVGKSDIIRSIAREFNLKVIDVRLSQCDPTDLNGFPYFDHDEGRARYMPMDLFPLWDDPTPDNYAGWLLFLDELSSAPLAVQAAAYKILLDKIVGQAELHQNVVIMSAGNLETDNAIVNPMTTAVQSRLLHLTLKPDSEQWLKWARSHGVHHMVTSYIAWRPQHLHDFDPNHNDLTFACPRTWEFASELMKVWDDADGYTHKKMPLMAGTVSSGKAREFLAYTQLYQDLPHIDQIIRDPAQAKLPNQHSAIFAVSGALGSAAKPEIMDPLVQYIRRLPLEFQVVALRECTARNRDVLETPAVINWSLEHQQELLV